MGRVGEIGKEQLPFARRSDKIGIVELADSPFEHAVAVVLDTSYFDSGHFHVEKVTQFAKGLAHRGVQLWIPQQVVLEWAVHTMGLLSDSRRAQTRLRNAGLLRWFGDDNLGRDAAEVAAGLQQRCERIPNVVVLPMNGAAAVAAVRDQILGTGPGRVEKGIRTGAVDSSWVRDALVHLDGDHRKIIFLTKNGADVRAAGRALGLEIRCWTGRLNSLFGNVFPITPIADGDQVTVLKTICTVLQLTLIGSSLGNSRNHAAPPVWFETDNIDPGDDIHPRIQEHIEQLVDPYVQIDPPIKIIDVRDIEVDNNGENTRTVRFAVRLLTDLRVDGRVIDDDGSLITLYDTDIMEDRLLRVPLAAELTDDGLTILTQTESASSQAAEQRFDDGYDAYVWLYTEEICRWEHITVHPLSEQTEGFSAPSSFQLRGPTGRTVIASLDEQFSLIQEWTLRFEGLNVSISGRFDPGGRMWLGPDVYLYRDDPVYHRRPYGLKSEGQSADLNTDEPYTALAVVWSFLLDTSAGLGR